MRLCAMAGVTDPGPLQHWKLEKMAEHANRSEWDKVAYSLAHIGSWLGVESLSMEKLHPLREATSLAEWAEFKEEAMEKLPEDLSNEEIWERWENEIKPMMKEKQGG